MGVALLGTRLHLIDDLLHGVADSYTRPSIGILAGFCYPNVLRDYYAVLLLYAFIVK